MDDYDDCLKLRTAIALEDDDRCKLYAKKLAKKKLDLTIFPNETNIEHYEDIHKNLYTVICHVNGPDAKKEKMIELQLHYFIKVLEIKRLIKQKYGIALDHQFWIFNNIIGSDDDIIGSYLDNDEQEFFEEVYLYVMGDNINKIKEVDTPIETDIVSKIKTFLKEDLAEKAPTDVSSTDSEPKLVDVIEIDKQDTLKWKCGICTFKNLPYRPGCEMCSTARPDNYKIPDGYIPTEEEKIFIN